MKLKDQVAIVTGAGRNIGEETASPVGKDEFDPTRQVVNLVGRPGTPMDLARAILFLVSEDSVFIAGEMLFVDGGAGAMLIGDRSGSAA